MDKKNSDKDTDSDKDDGKVISVSPGKQYVRGDTSGEKTVNAIKAATVASRKSGQALDKYLEDKTSESLSKYERSTKADNMLYDAYLEESAKNKAEYDAKGYKKGGLVRGAGVAQRGQGKMRVF